MCRTGRGLPCLPTTNISTQTLSQALLPVQDAYGGPTSPLFVDDFVNYTATVASALGSKVQYWSTFNEGQSFCPLGYGEGTFAPGQLVPHYKRCLSRPRFGPSIMLRFNSGWAMSLRGEKAQPGSGGWSQPSWIL